MVEILALTLTLAILPKTLSIKCCDSTQAEGDLTSSGKAQKCYETMEKTRHIDSNKQGSGKDCDFCTIEVFFPDRNKDVKAGKFYLQSCGSFDAAEFEHSDHDDIPLKTISPGEVIAAELQHDLDIYIQFGEDLSKLDNRTRRVCRVHRGRSGYVLVKKRRDAGVWPAKTAATIPRFVPTDVEELQEIDSVACACFDDECNEAKEVIPTEDDLNEPGEIHWPYGEDAEN